MRSFAGSAFLLLAGGIAACGSSSPAASGWAPGTGTLDGTLTFMPGHSWASAAATRSGPGELTLVVTNVAGGPDACQAANMGSRVSSLFEIVVTLPPDPSPGTYPLGVGWAASYRLASATCVTVDERAALAGTLEIDSVDAAVSGIAVITFPKGRVLASFNAPFCAAPEAGSECVRYPSCPADDGADQSPPHSACSTSL